MAKQEIQLIRNNWDRFTYHPFGMTPDQLWAVEQASLCLLILDKLFYGFGYMGTTAPKGITVHISSDKPKNMTNVSTIRRVKGCDEYIHPGWYNLEIKLISGKWQYYTLTAGTDTWLNKHFSDHKVLYAWIYHE